MNGPARARSYLRFEFASCRDCHRHKPGSRVAPALGAVRRAERGPGTARILAGSPEKSRRLALRSFAWQWAPMGDATADGDARAHCAAAAAKTLTTTATTATTTATTMTRDGCYQMLV